MQQVAVSPPLPTGTIRSTNVPAPVYRSTASVGRNDRFPTNSAAFAARSSATDRFAVLRDVGALAGSLQAVTSTTPISRIGGVEAISHLLRGARIGGPSSSARGLRPIGLSAPDAPSMQNTGGQVNPSLHLALARLRRSDQRPDPLLFGS